MHNANLADRAVLNNPRTFHHNFAAAKKIGETTHAYDADEIRFRRILDITNSLKAKDVGVRALNLSKSSKRTEGRGGSHLFFVDTEGTPYATEFAAVDATKMLYASGDEAIQKVLQDKIPPDSIFVCWNAAHDRKALSCWSLTAGLKWVDAMQNFRKKFPSENYKFQNVYRKFLGVEDYVQKHDALQDALDLQKLCEKLELTEDVVVDWKPNPDKWEILQDRYAVRFGWREKADFAGFALFVKGADEHWRRVPNKDKHKILSELL